MFFSLTANGQLKISILGILKSLHVTWNVIFKIVMANFKNAHLAAFTRSRAIYTLRLFMNLWYIKPAISASIYPPFRAKSTKEGARRKEETVFHLGDTKI